MSIPEERAGLAAYYEQLGELRAALERENPLANGATGKGVIFCFDASSFDAPDCIEAYKRGVHKVFPDCQFLVETGNIG